MPAGSEPFAKAKAKAKAKVKAKAKANPGGVSEVTPKTPEDTKAELGTLVYFLKLKSHQRLLPEVHCSKRSWHLSPTLLWSFPRRTTCEPHCRTTRNVLKSAWMSHLAQKLCYHSIAVCWFVSSQDQDCGSWGQSERLQRGSWGWGSIVKLVCCRNNSVFPPKFNIMILVALQVKQLRLVKAQARAVLSEIKKQSA